MKPLLILDEHSVASHSGVTFHLNPATKHPENPLLLPGEPHEWDSMQVIWPGSVLYDADEKLFRCWYHGMCAVRVDQPRRDPHVPWEAGYAESTDGIHWTKPKLGQSTHRGRPTNRLANDFDGWTFNTVFWNPDRNDRARRFLSIWKTTDTFHGPHMTWALASSPDGKSWKRENKAFCHEPLPRRQMQDFWQILYDPEAPSDYRFKSYMQYYVPRSWDGLVCRHVGLQHGPDLFHLRNAEPAMILAPEQGIDEELHFSSVKKVGNQYLMLFESDRFSRNHGDLRLAVSVDGIHFRRVHPNTPLVATGAKGMWDENLLVTTNYSMQEIGDEIWIYYFGCPNLFRNFPGGYAVDGLRGSLFYPSYLGLATLPRDRFAYATGDGTLTTRPDQFDPNDLWVNADGDGLRIALLSVETGRIIARDTITSERRHTVYRKVAWDCSVSLGTYQLQFTLTHRTKLYSAKAEK